MPDPLKNQLQGYIDTPELWINNLFGIKQFVLPAISLPDENEILGSLPELLSNFVLGKRMELFFKYVLESSGKYRVLAGNLQIHDQKITLGEIDFLAEEISQEQKFHIEVVYKFYIYDPSLNNELARWIGPNRKDSLLQKISKLQNHQFPLLFKSQTKIVLNNINLDPCKFKQQVSFKGHLFVPKDLQDKSFNYINNNCVSGYWIDYQAFKAEEYFGSQYFAPKKQDWPIHPSKNEEWLSYLSFNELVKEHIKVRRSPLIWMKTKTHEYKRFFIVWW